MGIFALSVPGSLVRVYQRFVQAPANHAIYTAPPLHSSFFPHQIFLFLATENGRAFGRDLGRQKHFKIRVVGRGCKANRHRSIAEKEACQQK
jgi:hypothetical protein